MSMLNFTTGVYWGQLSKCQVLPTNLQVDHYTCTSPILYGAISALTILVFISQLSVFLLLMLWRDVFIERQGGGGSSNEEYSGFLRPQDGMSI